jgi:hypothetical protein
MHLSNVMGAVNSVGLINGYGVNPDVANLVEKSETPKDFGAVFGDRNPAVAVVKAEFVRFATYWYEVFSATPYI